ncbi:hypothetical protein KTD26_12305 [Burkholderia multivorans]|uniref:hypothetical protein n=1 Tax=Burkholderia multivorans TaxID=87883 RepID=UPI001C238927|nr:hypothetical protein [Burkholderia multivorans]MBU9143302.1 hypothetical protein [Burkholderia multivorans]
MKEGVIFVGVLDIVKRLLDELFTLPWYCDTPVGQLAARLEIATGEEMIVSNVYVFRNLAPEALNVV